MRCQVVSSERAQSTQIPPETFEAGNSPATVVVPNADVERLRAVVRAAAADDPPEPAHGRAEAGLGRPAAPLPASAQWALPSPYTPLTLRITPPQ